MTIGAAHGVHHLIAPVAPFGGIELVGAFLTHQSWHVGTFAGPAGTGLQVFLSVDAGRSCAQDLAQVLYGMAVATRRVVLTGEGVTGPVDDKSRTTLQYVSFLGTIILAHETGIFRHRPGLVFAWEVLGELLVLRYDRVGHRGAAVVKHARHLRAPF